MKYNFFCWNGAKRYIKTLANFFVGCWVLYMCLLKKLYHNVPGSFSTLLVNCPPTPPLSQHFALIDK